MARGTGAVKRADIQGLRAIAVLAVVIFHGFHGLMPGGFVGVDVFFVLSGYLITGIILRPMEAGQFSLVEFYQRRVKRLFPALYTVLAVTLLLAFILYPPTLLLSLVESQLFTTLFTSNFYFLDKTDYFDIEAELMPLLHTWSLGVEEQFYLLFPPLLWAIHKWARPILWPTIALLAVASLIASQRWVGTHPDVAFYHPVSRAFELLIGSLCVWIDRRLVVSTKIARVIGAMALPILVASLFFISESTAFPGVVALVPTFATAALLISKGSFANRLIATPAMVRIGDLSYSLYLWHWPLLVFAKFTFPGSALATTVALGLASIAAWASYRFVEQPFLTKAQRHVLLKGGGAILVSFLITLPIYLNDGIPGRFSPELRTYLDASYDYNPDRPKCHMRSDRPVHYDETCIYGASGTQPSAAVWGDSHGTELAMVLGRRMGVDGQSLRSMTMSGCPAVATLETKCAEQVRTNLAAIKDDPAMKTLILVGNINGHNQYTERAIEGLKDTALQLKAAGKTVLIVYPIPTMDFDPPSKLMLEVRAGGRPEDAGLPLRRDAVQREHVREALAAFVEEQELLGIDPTDIFCDEEKCRIYRDGVGVLYYNRGHLSLKGADLLAEEILRILDL